MGHVRLWLKRYWLAELCGTATALLSVLVTHQLGGGLLLVALVAPWAENVGYYGVMTFQEMRVESRRANRSVFLHFLVVLRNLSLEFGPAEVLDTLLLRPGLIYLFAGITGNAAAGVVIGKIAADVVFYVPVILSFELRLSLSSWQQGSASRFLRRSRRPEGAQAAEPPEE